MAFDGNFQHLRAEALPTSEVETKDSLSLKIEAPSTYKTAEDTRIFLLLQKLLQEERVAVNKQISPFMHVARNDSSHLDAALVAGSTDILSLEPYKLLEYAMQHGDILVVLSVAYQLVRHRSENEKNTVLKELSFLLDQRFQGRKLNGRGQDLASRFTAELKIHTETGGQISFNSHEKDMSSLEALSFFQQNIYSHEVMIGLQKGLKELTDASQKALDTGNKNLHLALEKRALVQRNSIAVTAFHLGLDIEEIKPFTQESLKVAQSLEDEAEIATAQLNNAFLELHEVYNIADSSLREKMLYNCLETFRQNFFIFEKHELWIAALRAKINIAKVYKEKKNLKEARIVLQEAQELAEKQGIMAYNVEMKYLKVLYADPTAQTEPLVRLEMESGSEVLEQNLQAQLLKLQLPEDLTQLSLQQMEKLYEIFHDFLEKKFDSDPTHVLVHSKNTGEILSTVFHSHFDDPAFFELLNTEKDRTAFLQLNQIGPEVRSMLFKIIGLLHDIGKGNLSQSILGKNGKLESQEFDHIKGHTVQGANYFVRHIASFLPSELSHILRDCIVFHHEAYNGKGYPHGKKGEETPLLARMLRCTDVLEALCAPRTERHRDQVTDPDQALQIIADEHMQLGSFDPNLLILFIHALHNNSQAQDAIQTIFEGYEPHRAALHFKLEALSTGKLLEKPRSLQGGVIPSEIAPDMNLVAEGGVIASIINPLYQKIQSLQSILQQKNQDIKTAMELVHEAKNMKDNSYLHPKVLQQYDFHHLEILGTLGRSILHDINNLLSVILPSIQLLAYNTSDKNLILETLQEANSQILELLSYLQTCAVETEIHEAAKIFKTIEKFTQLCAKNLGKKNRIRFENQLSENIHLKGSQLFLTQSILNLVKNGFESMDNRDHPDNELYIKVETVFTHDFPQGALQIQIQDNGCGIPPERLPTIFEAKSSTKAGKNRGHGLANIKRTIENHTGKIYVESKVGEGTTFTILLPTFSSKSTNFEVTIEPQLEVAVAA